MPTSKFATAARATAAGGGKLARPPSTNTGAIDSSADWRDRARCAEADPEAFYPDKGESSLAAKRICARCDVRDDCLQEALERGERFGIWGGTSPRQRRTLLTAAATRRAECVPCCPWHGMKLSGGPIVWRCPNGRLGHRVTAADIQDAAEGGRAVA